MAKYGRLMEYTYAAGRTELCRTARPTVRNGTAAQIAEMDAKGWVLVKFLDSGGAYCHKSQLRDVSNDPR